MFTGAKIEKRPWLFFHYAQSPGLKHNVPSGTQRVEFGDILYTDYVRTIGVVSAAGIEEFMRRSWEMKD